MKVLIVDDDLALADIVAFILQRAGYQTILAHDGQTALQRWVCESPDLIILDLHLPKLSGFEICQKIRDSSLIPIIILSVRSGEEDIINGLKLGADDYVIKPFSPRQLLARLEAVLRRTGTPHLKNTLISIENMVLDLNRQEIQYASGIRYQLTYLESRLLDILVRNQGNIVPNDNIIDYVWGPSGGDRTMLKQLVYRLRHKIEPNPANPVYLETNSNLGYRFNKI